MKRLVLIIILCFTLLEAYENGVYNRVEYTLNSWNRAMNNHDAKPLNRLYSNKLIYYGKRVSKELAIRDKKHFFKKYPYFYQHIENSRVQKVSNSKYRVFFDKYVRLKKYDSPKKYPSYLTIKYLNSNWKITEEGDKITDKNLQSRSNKKDFILKNHLILESYKSSLYSKSLVKVYTKRDKELDSLGFKNYYLYLKSPNSSWWWKSPQEYSRFEYNFIDENRLLVVASNDLYETSFLINIDAKKAVTLGYGFAKYITYGKFKGMFKISGEKRYFFNKTKAQNGAYWIDYICDSRGNIIKYLNKADCRRKNRGNVESIFYIREIIENSKKEKHQYLHQSLSECIEVER